jgi:hypothetical protein
MKAHKVVLVFVDHDGLGPEETRSVLENARYPNRCMAPTVLDVQTVDVGEWSDDHPLNKTSTQMEEWKKLFPAAGREEEGAGGLRQSVKAFLDATDAVFALPDDADAVETIGRMNVAREEMRKVFLRDDSASSSPQRAFGQIREAAEAIQDSKVYGPNGTKGWEINSERAYLVPADEMDTILSALLGEAPPKAEQSPDLEPELAKFNAWISRTKCFAKWTRRDIARESWLARAAQATPGATVQPQARPMKLRAESIGLNLYLYEVNPNGGETFIGSICSKLFTAARKAEIAYRINSFEPPHKGGQA